MEGLLKEYDELLAERLGATLRGYQRAVGLQLLSHLALGERFVVVMMPTGSGKTVVEGLVAYWALKTGERRVLVLEPTRLLVDQLYNRFWKPLLGGIVGFDYEGRCGVFLNKGLMVVVSTAKTASKCLSEANGGFSFVLIDEVHRAYSNRFYAEALAAVDPATVIGFTALVTREKRLKMPASIKSLLGDPVYLEYDFKKLASLGGYSPPKAILDVYEAELPREHYDLYTSLYLGLADGPPLVDSRRQAFLAYTMARHGIEAYCESVKRMLGEGDPQASSLLAPCRHPILDVKAGMVREILEDYPVSDLKPVLIYASRVATAAKAARLAEDMGLRAALLTGLAPRMERLRIISLARKGLMDVIASTIVGEEGLDMPETGLMVFIDTPRSALRFYQRLGRLIRPRSSGGTKYLVIVRTVGTVDYDDLPEAVERLSSEGVDVSYVVVNLEEKGSWEALSRVLACRGGYTGFLELAGSPSLLGLSSMTEEGDASQEGSGVEGVVKRAGDIIEKSRVYRIVWEAASKGRAVVLLNPKIASGIVQAQLELLKPKEQLILGGVAVEAYRLTRPLISFKNVYTASSLIVDASALDRAMEALKGEAEKIAAEMWRLTDEFMMHGVGLIYAGAKSGLRAYLRVEAQARIGGREYRVEVRDVRVPGVRAKGFAASASKGPARYLAAVTKDGFEWVLMGIAGMGGAELKVLAAPLNSAFISISKAIAGFILARADSNLSFKSRP